MRTSLLSAAFMAVLDALPPSVSAQDVQAASDGARLFETRCAVCHSLDVSRIGPRLRGVLGRQVASVDGFAYTDALRQVGGRWGARRLEAWLRDPQVVAPGTAMGFSLASPADRNAVIRYLASTASPPGAAKR